MLKSSHGPTDKLELMEADPEPRVVRLGLGEVIITTGKYRGVPAVFIEPTPDPGPVGELADPMLPRNVVRPNSVVLQVEGDVSVLIDALNSVSRKEESATSLISLAEDLESSGELCLDMAARSTEKSDRERYFGKCVAYRYAAKELRARINNKAG